jgi:hypothetical protein
MKEKYRKSIKRFLDRGFSVLAGVAIDGYRQALFFLVDLCSEFTDTCYEFSLRSLPFPRKTSFIDFELCTSTCGDRTLAISMGCFLRLLVSSFDVRAMNTIWNTSNSLPLLCYFCIARSQCYVESEALKMKTHKRLPPPVSPVSPSEKERVLPLLEGKELLKLSFFQIDPLSLSRSLLSRAFDQACRPRRPSIPRFGCRSQGTLDLEVVTMRYGPSWDLSSFILVSKPSIQKKRTIATRRDGEGRNSPCTNPPNTRLPVCNNGWPTTIFKNRSKPLRLSSITLSSKRFRYTFPGSVGMETRALSRSSRSRKTSKSE